MAKQKTDEPMLLATPVAEGVRVQCGSASACAVRNQDKDIAVRVCQEDHFFRDLIGRVPFARGVARLFGAFVSFLSGIRESEDLEPRDAIMGSPFVRQFAQLFRTRPQTLSAGLSAIAIVLILGAMMLGFPLAIEMLLGLIDGLPRFAVNAVCCMCRVTGALLSVYMIARLKVLNRLCMYRGAAAKMLNAYEAYGSGLTHETVTASPTLTDRSDGAFLLVVLIVSIVAFACVYTEGVLLTLGYRLVVILAASAVCNELILPLEHANPNGRLAALRAPLAGLQHLFTIEPHKQMIEVAICAFHAAYDNDLSLED